MNHLESLIVVLTVAVAVSFVQLRTAFFAGRSVSGATAAAAAMAAVASVAEAAATAEKPETLANPSRQAR